MTCRTWRLDLHKVPLELRAAFGLLFIVAFAGAAPGQTRILSLELESPGRHQRDTRVLNAVTRAFEQSGRAKTVERKELKRVIDERILGETLGTLDAPEITVAAYKGLISYEFKIGEKDGEPLEQYGITVRLVDLGGNVEHVLTTAGAFNALLRKVKLKEMNSIEAAVKRLEVSIRRKLPAQGMVVQSRGDELVVDLGKNDGLSKRSTLTAVEFERIPHPDSGQIILHKRPIGSLKCFIVNATTSSCRLVEQTKDIGRSTVVELGVI